MLKESDGCILRQWLVAKDLAQPIPFHKINYPRPRDSPQLSHPHIDLVLTRQGRPRILPGASSCQTWCMSSIDVSRRVGQD